MNIKQKSLSLAVAAATVTIGSMGASAASFDRDFPNTCYNNYAKQTLASQEGKVIPGPVIHDDLLGINDDSGESMLSVDGTFQAGQSGQESRYLRIQLTGATFNTTLSQDEDVYIQNGTDVVRHLGGAPGDDYVIFAFKPDDQINIGDRFEVDLDSYTNSGLVMDDDATEVQVRYGIFQNQFDATHPEDAWPPENKTQCLADVDNDGLDFVPMKDVHDPVASVQCKDGWRPFTLNREKNFHGAEARPYSCFISKGRQNFGSFEIVTTFLDANDGMRTRPRDLFDLNTTYGATVTLSDMLGWVDTGNAYASNNYDEFPFCAYRGHRDTINDRWVTEMGVNVPWMFPVDGVRDTAYLAVGSLNPNTQDRDTGEGKWNVCLDDWAGDPREYDDEWNVEYDYPTIPLKDNLMVQLDSSRVMIDTEQGSRWSTAYSKKLDINGIDRNGMVLRFPVLLTGDRAKQKILLTNRGREDAEYKLFVTPHEGAGIPDTDLPENQGVIEAGKTQQIEVKDMVDFTDNKGAGIIVIAGLPEYIDAAEVLVGVSGDKAVENVTTDEGYNAGYSHIIASQDD